MRKVRWGLIGCGKVVLKNKTTPFINFNNTIVSICTTSINNSKKAKKKLNLKECTCHDDIYDMLNNNNIDAIYICTPPKYHYYYLNLLCKFKIPIYVEKPFTINYNEAKKITNLYEKNDTPIFVAHYKRLTKKIQVLKKLVNSNKIGEITSINGDFRRLFNLDLLEKSWIYNKEISGGGRFFDIAPHILDILYYIFGDFSDIKSHVIFEKELHNCENIVSTTFTLKNCINCNLYFDFISDYDKDFIELIGTKGKITLSINRDLPLNVFNEKGKLMHSYKFPKIKVWGIESVRAINKYLKTKKSKTDICFGHEATKIQKYIESILEHSN